MSSVIFGIFIGIAIFFIAFAILVFWAMCYVGGRSEQAMKPFFDAVDAKTKELEAWKRQHHVN